METEIPRKVKLAGDLQTVISNGQGIRHATIPKGTICDVVSIRPGKLTDNDIYKLRLYDEIFFAADIDVEVIK